MKSLKLKTLVLAAGLFAASLSTGAYASGTATVTPTGYEFSGTFAGGSFSDYLTLSVPNSDVFGGFSGLVTAKNATVHFTAFDIVDADHNIVILGNINPSTKYKTGGGDLDGTTAFGEYSLHIAGYSSGSGTYSGALTVSAVPEPETYGMMLAGLGLMGFAARRRKSV